jgi:hypothetical protein
MHRLFPLASTFAGTFRRRAVGLSSITLAVLSSERVAAVSPRRWISRSL